MVRHISLSEMRILPELRRAIYLTSPEEGHVISDEATINLHMAAISIQKDSSSDTMAHRETWINFGPVASLSYHFVFQLPRHATALKWHLYIMSKVAKCRRLQKHDDVCMLGHADQSFLLRQF